ncbi:MAG: hypothetical protein ACXVAW_17795 [Vulcanimicrobiaceae bacterium]
MNETLDVNDVDDYLQAKYAAVLTSRTKTIGIDSSSAAAQRRKYATTLAAASAKTLVAAHYT